MATPVRPAFPKWDRARRSGEGGGQDVREGCRPRVAQRRGAAGSRGTRGGPEGRLRPGREFRRAPAARDSPATPTPNAAAVQTPPEGAPQGERHYTGGEPSGDPRDERAAGLRTASTNRNRRRTKFRVAMNPPPSAAAPINKPSTMVDLLCRAPYATCASAVSHAIVQPGVVVFAATVCSNPASRGVMTTRIATATAVC